MEEILSPLREARVAQRVEVMEQVQTAERGGMAGRWFRSARDFLIAVRSEMSKVSWPTQQELVKATRMVVVMAILIGIMLGLVDLLLTKVLVEGVAALGR
jgi:preprotein translocase subunit SecE